MVRAASLGVLLAAERRAPLSAPRRGDRATQRARSRTTRRRRPEVPADDAAPGARRSDATARRALIGASLAPCRGHPRRPRCRPPSRRLDLVRRGSGRPRRPRSAQADAARRSATASWAGRSAGAWREAHGHRARRPSGPSSRRGAGHQSKLERAASRCKREERRAAADQPARGAGARPSARWPRPTTAVELASYRFPRRSFSGSIGSRRRPPREPMRRNPAGRRAARSSSCACPRSARSRGATREAASRPRSARDHR